MFANTWESSPSSPGRTAARAGCARRGPTDSSRAQMSRAAWSGRRYVEHGGRSTSAARRGGRGSTRSRRCAWRPRGSFRGTHGPPQGPCSPRARAREHRCSSVTYARGWRISWPTLAARRPSAARRSAWTSFASSSFAAVTSRTSSVDRACAASRVDREAVISQENVADLPARRANTRTPWALPSIDSRNVSWKRAPISGPTISLTVRPMSS